MAAPWEVREKIADDGTPLYGWGWSAFMGERSMSKDRWMLNAHVAGVTHRVKELQDDAFAPGQRVSLVADPENPYDPNAVEVWDADKRMQVGYLPKGENARVAKHLQDGQEIHALVVWEWRTAGRRTALRVLVSTEAPELSD